MWTSPFNRGNTSVRSYCLYNDNYVDIAEIYEVRDGKQINIPEKLKYYRKLSDSRQLFCECGCGEVVILVAGDRNLRKQHFRLVHKFVNSKCVHQEESDISIKAKIMLKCWLTKNFPVMEHGIKYRVPISRLAESNRKYELTMYSEDYNIGIIYNKHSNSIFEEKVELLSEYVKSKIIYVTRIENEETDGQYPEHMMRIQEAQGYCFYLDLDKESLYEEVEAKVSIYEKTHRGLWNVLDVCNGMLDDFGLNTDGLLVYKDELVSDLVDKTRNRFQTDQEYELEQIRKRKEEEWLRQEKERLERAERERLRQEKERKEQEECERLEEERRKQRELEQEREREERQRREEEERNRFLENYPKFARIYKLLEELKSIKSVFISNQWDGKTKNYSIELEIDKLRINRDKHRIEISDNKLQKVYIYILESGLGKINIPRTGVPYKIIDYTRIDDIENHFRMAFACIFKEGQNDVECSVPEIKCQFLGDNTICICEKGCTYQKR